MATAKVLLRIEDGLVERLAGELVTRMTLQTPHADRAGHPDPTVAQIAAMTQMANAIHTAR